MWRDSFRFLSFYHFHPDTMPAIIFYYFFSLLAFVVYAQTPISEIPPSCSVPSANPVCPPPGTLGFNVCGKYTRGQSCSGFCFAILTQYLVGTGSKCFARKPSFATTKKLYRACRAQCSYGRYKLRRSRLRKTGVLVSVGVKKPSFKHKIKASYLFYKLVEPTGCGGARVSQSDIAKTSRTSSALKPKAKTRCAPRGACQCWYCLHTGHRCSICCF